MSLFERTIPTGIKHGTVTVIWEGEPIELTTYRVDGSYTDFRRPDEVTFTRTLEEDLSRRDFTINAMACRSDGVVIDLFGGQEDLQKGVLRCVGDPMRRFREDALRILRGLRFAARYGEKVTFIRNQRQLSKFEKELGLPSGFRLEEA